MSVLDHAMGSPSTLEEHATVPLAGGVANYGYQCGMLWGAALAAGAQAYRIHGPGPQAETEAVVASQKIVASFRSRTKNEINCAEITDMNFKEKFRLTKLLKFFIKGGPVGCLTMSARCSRQAFGDINASLLVKHSGAATLPVSCAAALARRMGASNMHAVMAAGFAGGIGLSGGGCGALGAAIWINAMQDCRQDASIKAMITAAGATVEKFIKNTDFKLECREITGRCFENIIDHADYLRAGGCAKIIELLAAKPTAGMVE
jgi:hypothetical protein